jgi:hypothetical protein
MTASELEIVLATTEVGEVWGGAHRAATEGRRHPNGRFIDTPGMGLNGPFFGQKM